jgi:hypothetical protein
MESIQQQIGNLTRKIERVYQIVDRLDRHVFQDLDPQLVETQTSSEYLLDRSRNPRGLSSGIHDDNGYAVPASSNYCHTTAQQTIAQQDVSIEDRGIEISSHQSEQDLSPQVQIQRLTAQLTAAYNRIAALEEQLLANRCK